MIFDSWFSSLANLKLISQYGWTWLTRLKRNRLVNPDGTGNHWLQLKGWKPLQHSNIKG
ncbi:hypothetical protein CKA32_000496 [Geitlerinema sp. FC II]|nr:hypothetical protein CKA32_000496 [Geitlerinema sp. FC II]